MSVPSLIKKVVELWNDDTELVATFGEASGTTYVDESTELPFARILANQPVSEVHTGDVYMANYDLMFLVYGIQDAADHRLAANGLNRILLGQNCGFGYIDNHIRVLHVLPNANSFELVDTIAGRDLLVSQHTFKVLTQTDYLNPDD